jgi:hypothetical protein
MISIGKSSMTPAAGRFAEDPHRASSYPEVPIAR